MAALMSTSGLLG